MLQIQKQEKSRRERPTSPPPCEMFMKSMTKSGLGLEMKKKAKIFTQGPNFKIASTCTVGILLGTAVSSDLHQD